MIKLGIVETVKSTMQSSVDNITY